MSELIVNSETRVHPLVSVIIITYNSSRTVVETLESIKRQTYQDIELIVTDDSSKDNTQDVINDWLKVNDGRFERVVTVYSNNNIGLAGNVNRGYRVAQGKFFKCLAGDDCLIDTAIEKYVDYLVSNGNKFCVSNLEIFSGDANIIVPETKVKAYAHCFELCKESRKDKIKRLAFEYVLLSPGYFYDREVIDKLGGLDERFPMSDEVPFAMKVLKAGYDICALDEKLVLYRYSGESLSQHQGEKLGNKRWFKDNRRIFYLIQLPELLRTLRPIHAYSKMMRIEQTNMLYYNNVFAKIGYIIIGILNPYTYYTWMRRKLKR